MGLAQVVAIKGVDGFNRAAPVVGPTYVDATEGGRKIRRGARLWTVAAATFKGETYRFLRLAAPEDGAAYPAGYVHVPRSIDAEWVKQLVAEQLMTVKTRRGFTRLEWQKLRERNEALDCRVYARAVAWIVGIDRWTERKWQELERQLGIEAEAKPVSATVSKPAGQRTRADPLSGQRAIRSRWLGGRPRNWLQRR
jgi:phage terminase large subunit GpA-like protein